MFPGHIQQSFNFVKIYKLPMACQSQWAHSGGLSARRLTAEYPLVFRRPGLNSTQTWRLRISYYHRFTPIFFRVCLILTHLHIISVSLTVTKSKRWRPARGLEPLEGVPSALKVCRVHLLNVHICQWRQSVWISGEARALNTCTLFSSFEECNSIRVPSSLPQAKISFLLPVSILAFNRFRNMI